MCESRVFDILEVSLVCMAKELLQRNISSFDSGENSLWLVKKSQPTNERTPIFSSGLYGNELEPNYIGF